MSKINLKNKNCICDEHGSCTCYDITPTSYTNLNYEEKKSPDKPVKFKLKQGTKTSFFYILAFFLVASLSYSVAVSYNNVIQSLITKYTNFGLDQTIAYIINVVIITSISIAFMYLIYRYNPEATEMAVSTSME